jgi:hypothetical protein
MADSERVRELEDELRMMNLEGVRVFDLGKLKGKNNEGVKMLKEVAGSNISCYSLVSWMDNETLFIY